MAPTDRRSIAFGSITTTPALLSFAHRFAEDADTVVRVTCMARRSLTESVGVILPAAVGVISGSPLQLMLSRVEFLHRVARKRLLIFLTAVSLRMDAETAALVPFLGFPLRHQRLFTVLDLVLVDLVAGILDLVSILNDSTVTKFLVFL